MTRIPKFTESGAAHFITFACYHNYNLFKTDETKDIFINRLRNIKLKYILKLFGYVIMPNHIHLVILPQHESRLPGIIGELKSLSAREILAFWREKGLILFGKLKIRKDGKERYAFWQKRYYDHVCRTPDKVIEKIKYCHNNPVVRGLAKNPEDWRWSSYRNYHGEEGVPIEIDFIEQ